jgi:hypothetical protein
MPDNEIVRLIEKISERYNRIYGPSGNLVRLEADILLAEIRELYEKLSASFVADYSVNLQKKVHVEEIVQQEEEPERNDEFVLSFSSEPDTHALNPDENIPEPVPEFTPVPESVFPEPVEQLIYDSENLGDQKSTTPVPFEVSVPKPATSVRSFEQEEHHGYSSSASQGLDLFGAPLPTLADKLSEEKRSVNEKMHSETGADKSIASTLRQPVTDLKTSIGINDRFLFINELFEGDMRNYDETLRKLNTCATLQDALAVFEMTKRAGGWTEDMESVDKLLDFVHRRYS